MYGKQRIEARGIIVWRSISFWFCPDFDAGRGFGRHYPKDFGTNGIELYDMDADIGEKHNLADQYPEIVKELMPLKLNKSKK
jgi:hypothetical protein